MKTITLVVLGLVVMGFSSNVYAYTLSYAERTQIAIAQNNAEIQRKHELQMEIAKAETLKAEKELERSIEVFNVSANADSNSVNSLSEEA